MKVAKTQCTTELNEIKNFSSHIIIIIINAAATSATMTEVFARVSYFSVPTIMSTDEMQTINVVSMNIPTECT